jgi:hypothetical protein
LRDARARHDARFAIDHPKPAGMAQSRLATVILCALWVVLALAGTGMSYPHSYAALSAAGVDVAAYPWFPAVAFIGIELGAVLIAYAASLKAHQRRDEARKVWSLRGALREIVVRVGGNPDGARWLDVEHLPDARPATGGALALASLAAMLIFNLRDTIGAEWLVHLAEIAAGVAGPVLVYFAGHRFAEEIATATSRSALARWEAARQSSWSETGQGWIDEAMGGPSASPAQNGRRSGPERTADPLPDRVHQVVRSFADRPGLTFDQRAEALDVSPTTVKRWTKEAVEFGLLHQDRPGSPYYVNGSANNGGER